MNTIMIKDKNKEIPLQLISKLKKNIEYKMQHKHSKITLKHKDIKIGLHSHTIAP
jgi:hypothetical protein